MEDNHEDSGVDIDHSTSMNGNIINVNVFPHHSPASYKSFSLSTLLFGSARLRTVPLHNLQVLDDDLGARPNENLALASLLRVVERLQCVREDAHANHFPNARVSSD